MKSAIPLLVLCLLAATTVRADTIFTTFGASQSFDNVSSWPIGGLEKDEFAASFAPTQDFSLDAIDFAAVLFSGSDPLTVEITDSTGSPASPSAPIETFEVASVPGVPTVLTVDSTSHPLLLAGVTYWVVLSTAASSDFGWNWNDQGFVGVSFRNSGTSSWIPFGTEVPTPAFDVIGSTPTSGIIPEPSSIWLLAAALVAGITFSRSLIQPPSRRLAREK
jgi:hypothetical protein